MNSILKNVLSFTIVLVVTGAFAGFFCEASGASPSYRPIDDNDTVVLPGNVYALARPEFDQGATRSSLRMERMILTLKRSPEKQVEVDTLFAELHDPSSPNYQRWVTPEEFGERFGPAPEDIEAIARWLMSHGFVVEEVAKGRAWVNFSGTVADVERAFRTQIHDYYIDGRLYHANVQDPSIPRALADVVAGVVSLHNFPRTMMHSKISPLMRTDLMPDYTSGATHYLSPNDFSTIYNVNALYNAGIDGNGQNIAIVGRTHPSSSDWTTFRSMMGLSTNPPQVIVNGPDPGDLGGDEDVEADLDVEWSGAVAKNAGILFVVSKSTYSTDGVDLSAQYIVNNNLAPVMSTSFSACESDLGTAGNNFYNDLWQQAAAQGITSFVSSGDAGAAGCNSGSDTVGSGLGVNGLASTPYNVAVGGTQFNEGSGSYWNTSNGSGYASAVSYIPEVVWNQSGVTPGGSGLWSTGGGASLEYDKPAWQASPGVPEDGQRDVPDISLSAATHDAYLVETRGALYGVGGTSASSPSFAGLMALIVQNTGQRQGNANTRLYQLGNSQYGVSGAVVFHDSTSGDNSVPGVTGYSGTTGYDLCTGLGSVDAFALVNNWTPDFTISASPAAVSVPQGTMGTSTISTAASGNFSNVVSLSASGLPTGVTVSFSPATIATPSSGNAIFTITVGASAVAGTYPVTVTGTSGSTKHTATVSLTIPQTFSVTSSVTNGTGGAVTPSTTSVVSGGSATLTIVPVVGYHLFTLTDNGADVTASVVNSTYTITNITTAHTIVATFAINTYSVNASVSTGNGSITPTGTEINYGSNVVLTITPAAGYHLMTLTDNSVDVTSSVSGANYTITDVTGPHTVVAAFVINTYSVNAVSDGNGSITTASSSVDYGTTVSFTITPDTGYTLSGLTDNGVAVTAVENTMGTLTYTINNISTDHTVQASFSPVTAAPVPALGQWGFLAVASGLLWLAMNRKGRNL
jgi:subtilase family serine protease